MDYTKYNFNAIIGAEVEMQYGYSEIFGKVAYSTDDAVIIQSKDCAIHPVYKSSHIMISKGIIVSLSAKIKVEDMSVKQLKRFIKPRRCCREAMLIAEDGVHHSLRDSYGEIKYDYDEFDKSFADYVDCTDWGWKE